MSGELHSSAALPPGKEPPNTHLVGGWVNLRTGLDDLEGRKILPLPERELRHLGRPARSQSLYRQCQRTKAMQWNVAGDWGDESGHVRPAMDQVALGQVFSELQK
jgi:hypothetical protein